MHGWTVLLAVGVAVAAIARQVLPRRVSWKMLIAVPLILGYFAWKQLPAGPFSATEGIAVGLELALAIACGTWQASVTSVYDRGGTWYMRGGWRYLAAWAFFVAGDIGIRLAVQGPAGLVGAHGAGGTWISLIGAASAWAVRALVFAVKHPEVLRTAPMPAAEPGAGF